MGINYLPARADSEIKESSQDKDRDPGGTCVGATAGRGIPRTTSVCCQLVTGRIPLGKTTSVLEHRHCGDGRGFCRELRLFSPR